MSIENPLSFLTAPASKALRFFSVSFIDSTSGSFVDDLYIAALSKAEAIDKAGNWPNEPHFQIKEISRTAFYAALDRLDAKGELFAIDSKNKPVKASSRPQQQVRSAPGSR